MTRPTRRCVLLLLAGMPVALLPALVSERFWPLWPAWIGAVLLLAVADALLAVPARRLERRVAVPETLLVGDDDEATVSLDARGWRVPARVSVLLDLAEPLAAQEERVGRIVPGARTDVVVPLVAKRRGVAHVEALWLRWTGPLGLVVRILRERRDDPVAVVPNAARSRRAALSVLTAREFQAGLKSARFVGEGSEFEAMREFVPGMDSRAISWRASAKHRTLIGREYRAERNQQVVVALDTGPWMAERLEGIPRLDHAIHAGLALAYAALRSGDRVGLCAFDDKPRAFAAPRGAMAQFSRLQHLAASLEYGREETNFTLGLTDLSRRLRRRSLVVLFSDLVDTVTAELLVENAGAVRRRHLVVFVTFHDPALREAEERAPRTSTDVSRAVVAASLARERDLVLRRLEHLGVVCVDAPPGLVPGRLLDHYLRAKRRELVG